MKKVETGEITHMRKDITTKPYAQCQSRPKLEKKEKTRAKIAAKQKLSTSSNQKNNKSRPIKASTAKQTVRIIIKDDSILLCCKQKKILFNGVRYSVTGYFSTASGSLLVPASRFSQEIPQEVRRRMNIYDPNHLMPAEKAGSIEKPTEWNMLATQSVLHRSGYTVKRGTPKDERHKVLDAVIESKQLSKEEVRRHIQSLIARNYNRYPDACRRWQEDIDYLHQLSDSE